MSRKHHKEPSQRQLRAGELVRHALVDILRREDLRDHDLQGVSVTVSEVRMSPDLKHAKVYCAPLGGAHTQSVIEGLNRCSRFLGGRLGREIDMKFTPKLAFHVDDSFEMASAMDKLLHDPRVLRDLEAHDDDET